MARPQESTQETASAPAPDTATATDGGAGDPTVQATVDSARGNIRTMADLEHASLAARTRAEKVGDALTRLMGTLTFVSVHLLLFAAWWAMNTRKVPHLRPFDPFPFGALNLLVAAEGVLLAIFVLITQNRMSRQAKQMAHLNLQITLLAEQESTLILQTLRTVADRLGVQTEQSNPEVDQLTQRTHLGALAGELDQHLPEG